MRRLEVEEANLYRGRAEWIGLQLAAARVRPSAPFAELLDNLCVLSDASPALRVVLAGTSLVENVGTVATGLARRAASRGLRVLTMELVSVDGKPILRSKAAAALEAPTDPTRTTASTPCQYAAEDRAANLTSLSLDPRGGPLPATTEKWFEQAEQDYDVMIIEGPPLDAAIDAATLARTCDGLVLVIAAGATTTTALKSAIATAQSARCRILGLAVTEARDCIPARLRRILPTTVA